MAGSIKGRGALSNPPGRFDKLTQTLERDGWYEEEAPNKVETILMPEPARSIISRNDSPDIGFGQSINPYRGCEHACIYCLGGETPVLMADGTEKPLAELRVGDAIVGTQQDGHDRVYRSTTVLAHWSVSKPTYRVTFADGSQLLTSSDHRFLDERGWGFVWPNNHGRHLAVGDRLMGPGRATRNNLVGETVLADAQNAVARIEALDTEVLLFDITTGTEDFIANGVGQPQLLRPPQPRLCGPVPRPRFRNQDLLQGRRRRLLEAELAAPKYRCSPIMLGANTDPYQPLEKKLRVTRSILEVLVRCRHPVNITTKGALVARDVDLLAALARDGLARVMFSIPTLNPDMKRILEPRAASAAAKLKAMRVLAEAGVEVGVLVAPIIPVLTEHEIESVLEAAREAGASLAGYTILRLPWEVKDLFREWLAEHFPERAAHVMSQVRAMRGERDNDPDFGTRMHATGPVAELIRQRFQLASRRLGFPPKSENSAFPRIFFSRPCVLTLS
jgi:DNA repair photolyase